MARYKKLKTRYDAAYLLGERNRRIDDFSSWHSRIREARRVANGEWSKGGKPTVTNLVESLTRDAARLANEVEPSYYAPPRGGTKDDDIEARLRSIIGEGYFEEFDLIRPQLVIDAILTGVMCTIVYPESARSPYPIIGRVDPVEASPMLYNGRVIDLLVCQTMPLQVAARMFPSQNILKSLDKDEDDCDSVEIYSFFREDEAVRAIGVKSLSGYAKDAEVLQMWNPGTELPPVGWYQLPSSDTALRGLTDQVEGSLQAKDEMVKNSVEYSRQYIYSSYEAKGIINATTPPGPDVIYQHDPSMPGETFMRRVSPAQSSGDLFSLVGFLDQEQRNGLGYPATREGQVDVSQGSGSFVAATQGKLTSLVRELQRGLTQVQAQSARAAFDIDVNHLDFEKPLVRAVGRKKTYTPSSDIAWNRLTVNYGASAGLDRLNTDVRLLQFYSAGVIPAVRMLGEIDFVDDPQQWLNERQDEELERIALQRFSGDPTMSIDFLMTVLQRKQLEGESFLEAYQAVSQEMSSQVAPQAGAEQGMLSPAELGPEEPAAQAEALAAGATGEQGAPPIAGEFAKTPLQQVFVQ